MGEQSPSSDQEERFVHELTAHHDALLRFVKTMVPHAADAEDVFQRASVSLWKKHHEFDATRSFYPWACRFVHYEVLNYRKRAARDRLSFSEELIDMLAAEQIEAQPELEQRRKALNFCIDKLSAENQRILQRRYEENRTVASLADEWKRTPKQLYKILEKLRRNLSLCVDAATKELN